MENLLLIMPFFMGYEECLKKALEKKYHVTVINSEQYNERVLDWYYRLQKLTKHFYKIERLSPIIDAQIKAMACSINNHAFLSQVSDEKNYYQIILCINGQCVGESVIRRLKERNSDAKFIYYLWDDLKNLFHLLSTSFFDIIASYNIEECRQKGWMYLPVFVQGERHGHEKINEYDISFVGTAYSDRVELANKLYDKYSDKYRIFVYLYDLYKKGGRFCQSVPLSYEDYLNIVRRSVAVLDAPISGQTGPTTRLFDALLTDTKVLTTNKDVAIYPVYSPNVCIIDHEDLEIPEEFIRQPYIRTDYNVPTVEKWIEVIGL